MIQIQSVHTRQDREKFLLFPWKIYSQDPIWVPPLLPDWRERMDPSRGVFYQRGEAEFFLALQDGEVVGTICAAVDHRSNIERGAKECLFGFLNFIDNQAVFDALFRTVEQWALSHGLQTLTGPFNLDYEDGYGVLIEGRDRPPTLLCGHSPAYYAEYFDRASFHPARGDNIAMALDLSGENAALADLSRMADRVRARKDYRIRSARLDEWELELDRILMLLNQSLAHLPDHRDWQREVVHHSMAPFRKIVDPDLVLFAEDDEQVVGWLPGIPDLNEVFIRVNGLRAIWNYVPLLWGMKRRTRCLAVKSVLVPPQYWGSGVAILLFDEMVKRSRARGYQWLDLSLTSLDNPRTPMLGERFGAKIYKRYRVYRKQIEIPREERSS